MNPNLDRLQPYPFEKLREVQQTVTPPAGLNHISLSIGEPKHPCPDFVREALIEGLAGLGNYPATAGLPRLRQAIASWLALRYRLPESAVDPETQVLPVNGTREALFSIAQCLVNPVPGALVAMPNPFYQIYEGAALLAGATPLFIPGTAETGHLPDYRSVTPDQWARCQALYLCSPGNPSGAVTPREQLVELIELADRYDFVILADECYSEIYGDESNPPVGLLEVANGLGRTGFGRLLVFNSLSKRSNVPGLRSGFVAGDAALIERYRLYRTYHGCAMPLQTQAASIAAWEDESHVIDNRRLYRAKFDAVLPLLSPLMEVYRPEAGFFLWPKIAGSDVDYARDLYAQTHVTVLPGSFLSRDSGGHNPGAGFLRIALVADRTQCLEAAERMADFAAARQR